MYEQRWQAIWAMSESPNFSYLSTEVVHLLCLAHAMTLRDVTSQPIEKCVVPFLRFGRSTLSRCCSRGLAATRACVRCC